MQDQVALGAALAHPPLSRAASPALLARETVGGKRLTFSRSSYIISRPESSMQHEEQHRLMPFEVERGRKFVDLITAQRTRYALDGFHADSAPHGALSRCSPHERTVTIKDTRVGRIIDFLDRILTGRKLIGKDQILVKRGNSSQDAINTRRW